MFVLKSDSKLNSDLNEHSVAGTCFSAFTKQTKPTKVPIQAQGNTKTYQ